MALVSSICQKTTIPHEPTEHMVLRKLSWRQLEKAAEIRSEKSATRMKNLGGDVLTALNTANGADGAEEMKKAQADPLNTYDRGTLLEFGIASWSYPTDCTKEAKENLDDETADWAAREIVKLSKPEKTAEQQEADRKNA